MISCICRSKDQTLQRQMEEKKYPEKEEIQREASDLKEEIDKLKTSIDESSGTIKQLEIEIQKYKAELSGKAYIDIDQRHANANIELQTNRLVLKVRFLPFVLIESPWSVLFFFAFSPCVSVRLETM